MKRKGFGGFQEALISTLARTFDVPEKILRQSVRISSLRRARDRRYWRKVNRLREEFGHSLLKSVYDEWRAGEAPK